MYTACVQQMYKEAMEYRDGVQHSLIQHFHLDIVQSGSVYTSKEGGKSWALVTYAGSYIVISTAIEVIHHSGHYIYY